MDLGVMTCDEVQLAAEQQSDTAAGFGSMFARSHGSSGSNSKARDATVVPHSFDYPPEPPQHSGNSPTRLERLVRLGKMGLPVVAGTVIGGAVAGPVGAAAGASKGFATVTAMGLGAYGGAKLNSRRRSASKVSDHPVWHTLHQAFIDSLGENDGICRQELWTASERQFFDDFEPEATSKEMIEAFVVAALSSSVHIVGRYCDNLLRVFHERNTADDPSADTIADAHAVVQRLMAAILEAYPPLRDSPESSSHASAAAQTVAFESIYEKVQRSIRQRCVDEDAELTQRLAALGERRAKKSAVRLTQSVEMLQRMPRAHTSQAKMRCLTMALEAVAQSVAEHSGESVSADSLLPLVCRALAEAELSYPASEMAFMLEFGDVDELLRGREGYAVTTFQAACHVVLATEVMEVF